MMQVETTEVSKIIKKELKNKVITTIDENATHYLNIGRDIYNNPETGYKEFRTTEKLFELFNDLGLNTKKNIAYTGCRAFANEEKKGPKIAIMGELDSVICPDHVDSSKETGAMHACGHNIQVTVMYGVAHALVKSGIMDDLDGRIDFIGVPAEEYIETVYREELKKKGEIKYYSGKPELIYRGSLDDTNICMMVHNFPIMESGYKVAPCNTGNGFIGKTTRFIGVQSHAGGAPWDGINALNMATLAMSGMSFQRETFKDADKVRIHQVITKGGQALNSVPSEVILETTVRASNIKALTDANEKVKRSIKGAAIAIGGEAIVNDMPGQMPMNPEIGLSKIFLDNAKHFYSEEEIMPYLDTTSSFDMGDISHIMPVLHGITSGITGGLHSKDYKIISEIDAYIIPIKIMTLTLIDLLYNNAEKAKKIIKDFKPIMTKEEYLNYLEEVEKEHFFN